MTDKWCGERLLAQHSKCIDGLNPLTRRGVSQDCGWRILWSAWPQPALCMVLGFTYGIIIALYIRVALVLRQRLRCWRKGSAFQRAPVERAPRASGGKRAARPPWRAAGGSSAKGHGEGRCQHHGRIPRCAEGGGDRLKGRRGRAIDGAVRRVSGWGRGGQAKVRGALAVWGRRGSREGQQARQGITWGSACVCGGVRSVFFVSQHTPLGGTRRSAEMCKVAPAAAKRRVSWRAASVCNLQGAGLTWRGVCAVVTGEASTRPSE